MQQVALCISAHSFVRNCQQFNVGHSYTIKEAKQHGNSISTRLPLVPSGGQDVLCLYGGYVKTLSSSKHFALAEQKVKANTYCFMCAGTTQSRPFQFSFSESLLKVLSVRIKAPALSDTHISPLLVNNFFVYMCYRRSEREKHVQKYCFCNSLKLFCEETN